MSGGIDDVDVRTLPGDSAVFCKNRNAAFFFNGIVVHHGIDDFLVLGKGARLPQQLVHHGGLAMVHVGNDGDVSNLLVTHGSLSR